MSRPIGYHEMIDDPKGIDRREFVKHSSLGLAMLAWPGVGRAGPGPDPLSWEAVMAKPWTRPAKLDGLAGVHPRLILTGQRLEEVKGRIATSHREIWRMVKEQADRMRAQPVPANFKEQGDMRDAGRGIPWQALAYRVTGEKAYLDGAKRWLNTICRFPHWENDRSLAGGECLFGVAIGYDWLFPELTQAERTLIREKLVRQATIMKDGPPVHNDRWLANHNHVEHVGLAAAGFALYDEVPEAIGWIRQADLVFREFLNQAGPDGGSTEGHQYWAYTTESALRYFEAARDLLGSDYYDHEWLRSVPDFVIGSTLPDFDAEECVMTYGDAGRSYASHGPTHILYRLAAEYRNPYAQWLAREMDRRNVGRGDFSTWANLLWYDERVEEKPISELPTFSHSEDVGWVTSRSDWSPDAVMVGFRSGPLHGHEVQLYYERQYDEKWPEYHWIGGGHGHPDANAFQVYAHGKWLASDPGYERGKATTSHSTLLIDGKGQIGDGGTWMDRGAVLSARASSEIVKTESTAGYDYVVGSATRAYALESGLTKFHRHFIYLKPEVIVVVDELESDRPVSVDWLLQTEVGYERNAANEYMARNGDAAMDVRFLLPVAHRVSVDGKTMKLTTRLDGRARIVTVLNPRTLAGGALRARLEPTGAGIVGISLQSQRLRSRVDLDLAAREVRVTPGTTL